MPFGPTLRYQLTSSCAVNTVRLKKTVPLLPFLILWGSGLTLPRGRGRSFVRSEIEQKRSLHWDVVAGR